jgi:hypothetical protein
MSSLMDALAASSAPVTASTPGNCAISPGPPGTWYCSPAASAGWPARRSQATSVYLLAVVWDRPKTRARCSGSARAVSASWSARPVHMQHRERRLLRGQRGPE